MNYILIFILICFSAFFSGTEIAYTSANRARIEKKAEDGSRVAKLALKLFDDFESNPLTALLVGNNFVNISASAVSTTIAIGIAGGSGEGLAATVATAIITVLILIFGEIVPKVVFKKNSERMAYLTAYPLMFFVILFSPITFLVSLLLKLCAKIWGKPAPAVTEDVMVTIIETVEEEGGIDPQKGKLLRGALEFPNTTLSEIIRHRTKVLALDIDEDPAEHRRVIDGSKYSRLPVYKDSIDNIVGILNITQFYKRVAADPEVGIGDVMLEPLFLPGTMNLNDALDKMRESRMQMAVVPDEYGGTLGIVTTEDLLEQIVGDIWDERDEIVYEIVKNDADGSFTVRGDMNVYDFFEEMDVDDRDFESDCNTVGGWCVEMLGETPEVGMAFDYKNLRIILTEVDETHVDTVSVTVTEIPEEEE